MIRRRRAEWFILLRYLKSGLLLVLIRTASSFLIWGHRDLAQYFFFHHFFILYMMAHAIMYNMKNDEKKKDCYKSLCLDPQCLYIDFS